MAKATPSPASQVTAEKSSSPSTAASVRPAPGLPSVDSGRAITGASTSVPSQACVSPTPLAHDPAIAARLALPASIVNEYDPFNPSLFEGAAAAVDFAAQRAEREQALAEQMQRMETEQARLQAERKAQLAAAAASATAPSSNAGRGRGRGVSLLPAWATKNISPTPGGLAAGTGLPVAPDGMSAAERMMAKMGHIPGQGLGKHGTGITSALEHQKTGQNTGVIVQAGSTEHEEVGVRGTPSSVLLLRNIFIAGQWNEASKADVLHECNKHAPALNCVVVELSPEECRRLGVPPAAAIRVFVEFESVTGAAAAGIALHGRSYAQRTVDASFFPVARYSSMQLLPQADDV